MQVSLKMEIAATATLTQMDQQIQEAGQQAMREALKQTIRQWEEQNPSCLMVVISSTGWKEPHVG